MYAQGIRMVVMKCIRVTCDKYMVFACLSGCILAVQQVLSDELSSTWHLLSPPHYYYNLLSNSVYYGLH